MLGSISISISCFLLVPLLMLYNTLKEYIEYYKNRGTTVFVTFLDASKAFDRLNYWLLFDKLVKKCVPFIYN